MANPLKQKLTDRLQALQQQRAEHVARHQAELALIDGQIAAIARLAQNWETYTVEQALAELDKTGVILDLKS